MPDIFDNEWDKSSPNWHSGLKTLPRSRFASPQRVHREYPVGSRWDLENEKILPHQRSRSAPPQRPLQDNWTSGLKTLENAKAVKRNDRISQISQRPDHGAVNDWEYTSTLHKTLEVGQPKPGHESWLTENYKVLPDHEAHFKAPHQQQSPYKNSQRLLETETVPVAEWNAGQKVVPANRRRKFFMNNHSDLSYRAANVQKESHIPSDGTWGTENSKTLESRKLRRGYNDEWEGGAKVVPEANLLARARHFSKVTHPYSWFEESHKTLPYESSHKPNIYRFSVENTGWDSALYKTFDPAQQAPSTQGPRARIPYAANHDWYKDGKRFPASEQHIKRRGFVHAGTGWDSGLKTLPPTQQTNPKSPSRRARGPGYWDVDNRKTLSWEIEQTTAYGGEANRHIARPRHLDMAQFHQRMCRHETTYTY